VSNGSTTRKPFTAELRRRQLRHGGDPVGEGAKGGAPSPDISALSADLRAQHDAVLGAIRSLREDLGRAASVSDSVVDEFKKEINEAAALKSQLQEMSEAIDETKREIVALKPLNEEDDRILAVSNELDQVVATMEQATENIIEAAESIDEQAGSMRAQAADESEIQRAEELSDIVVRIFEACNFQDLTGQRITKVVNTLKFIEERVNKMMDIWGGESVFAGVSPDQDAHADDDARLLNGPQDESTKINQDQIDALFD